MSAIDRGRYALDNSAGDVKRDAQSGRGWYAVLARTGLVAKGLSFGLVGALALKLALGDGGEATSRQGALAQLAHHSFGKIVLIGLALGFAAYALWRFVQAFAEESDGDDSAAKVWAKRAGYVGRGVIYAGLTLSAVKILTGSGGGQSQNENAHKSTAMVLSWPAGTLDRRRSRARDHRRRRLEPLPRALAKLRGQVALSAACRPHGANGVAAPAWWGTSRGSSSSG